MSNQVNTELLERAAEMVGYFESKLPAILIQNALDSGDLDEVRRFVAEAEAEAARQEMNGFDTLPESEDIY